MPEPLDILKHYWNYTAFRTPQEAVINAVLSGKDTLALLPTGGGKSVCFQIPALAKAGLCIVISPLVALIKDQVANLSGKGIKAVALTGGLAAAEVDRILDNCMYGGYKFLYLSPERLQQETVQERIRQMQVNLIAVDEAHCISQWGNDFRPAYRNCSILRTFFPKVPVIALTASATGAVVHDIIENLKLREAAVLKKSFARENIAYMVFEEADKLYKTAHILKKNHGAAIVYVTNRKAARDVSEYLNRQGIRAGFYHGGIPAEEKTTRLQQWLNDSIRVMVATNAFGMGIDKPDVRVVIHIHLPETMENYYQEAGRAGRDGKKAFAVLLKNPSDAVRIKKQFLDGFPDVDFMKLLYKKLNNYFQIAYGEGDHSTFVFNFNDFCNTYHFHPVLAYNGIKLLDRNSVVSLSEAFNSKTSVRFTVGNRPLLAYLDRHPKVKSVTQSILRTYGGIFDHETKINLRLISIKAGTAEAVVREVLEQLQADAIIAYKAEHTDAEITFLLPREDDKTINTIAKHIEQQRRLKTQQLDAMIAYSSNEAVCKSVQLLAYFGEEQPQACGICSVCAGKKAASGITGRRIEDAVLAELSRAPLSSRELTKQLPYNEHRILQALQTLLEAEKISVTINNTYTIISK